MGQRKWRSGFATLALLMFVLSAGAAEHPGKEHPGEKTSEHPGKEEHKVTKEMLSKVIQDYVKKESKLKGGFFLMYDEQAKKPLVLSLLKVHEDRLSVVDKGVYFACVDFKTPEGNMYDLDIFMKEKDEDKELEVTEITIHKEEGKARYGWVEQKGVWKRK